MRDRNGTKLQRWRVSLGMATLTVTARSHQSAKRAAMDYWASGCADRDAMMASIQARIAEKWRGGIRAQMVWRKGT